MNKVELSGRLARAPEIGKTNSGKAVGKLTVALDRHDDNGGADFIPVVVWNAQAENCARYLIKGQKVEVVGHLRQRSYVTDRGTQYVLEVVAETVEFGEKPKSAAQAQAPAEENSGFHELEDEQLPF